MSYLNGPQCDFLAMEHKYRAFVAGFGSGKTFVGCTGLVKHSFEYPGVNAGYFAPTYAQIRDIFYPTMEEVADSFGMEAKVLSSAKEIKLIWRGRVRTTIICRSMDNPSSIIGFKIGHAMVDELDVMALDKARLAWRKIIARMRYKAEGLRNRVDVTTTPEGFKFVYHQWVKAVRDAPELADMYGMVQASTYDNAANLPEDYIPSLRSSYPPQLIDAYLKGKFVNLASGSVYPGFDRVLNHTPEKIVSGEVLHVGMDFNVLNMHAGINVIRNDQPRTLAELVRVRDTPTMARMLKERYLDAGHPVLVYPDATGGNTSTHDASESDLTILRQAGLSIRVNNRNPSVKDRVNSVDALLLNGNGERRWLINTDACPVTTECLEQQCWGPNNEPDKTSGFDHMNDANGYFLVNRFPIVKRLAFIGSMRI